MMLLLDTNIISEIMKKFPDESVMQWLRQQHSLTLYVSSISIAEMRYGLSIMPEGKKRSRLESSFVSVMQSAFYQRVFVFDENAAIQYAALMSKNKKMGIVMSTFDAQIASIAIATRSLLVTRNTKDFIHCGIQIINPFEN